MRTFAFVWWVLPANCEILVPRSTNTSDDIQDPFCRDNTPGVSVNALSSMACRDVMAQIKLEAIEGPRNVIGIILPERSVDRVCEALRNYEVSMIASCLNMLSGGISLLSLFC